MKFIKQIIAYVCTKARHLRERIMGIEISFSEPLPDGDYIITDSGDKPCRVKLKRGRLYLKKEVSSEN